MYILLSTCSLEDYKRLKIKLKEPKINYALNIARINLYVKDWNNLSKDIEVS